MIDMTTADNQSSITIDASRLQRKCVLAVQARPGRRPLAHRTEAKLASTPTTTPLPFITTTSRPVDNSSWSQPR